VLCIVAAIIASVVSCQTLEDVIRKASKENPHNFALQGDSSNFENFQAACGVAKTGKSSLVEDS
jgi:hypothetical protein